MVSPSRILVLCTGNLCRSPLAAAALQRLSERAGVALQVRSRGLSAALGHRVPAGTLAAAAASGLCLEDHTPSQVTAADAEWAEEALVMEPWQRERLQALRADLLVTGLWEELSLPEIPDPYGRSPEFHAAVGRLLEQALGAWLARRFPGPFLA